MKYPALAVLVAAVTAMAQDNGKPVPAGPPAYSPSPAYVGDTIRFTVKATDPEGDALTYAWNFGDGGSLLAGPSPEASHVFTGPGRYAVIVRIRDSVNSVTASTIVAVNLVNLPLRPTSASSIILDSAAEEIWCVNPDNHSVSRLDAETLELRREIPTGNHPQTLAQSADGSIWVANKGSSTLSVLTPGGTVVATLALPYGAAPHGIAFSPDGKAGFVTLEGAGKLLKLDPASRLITGELALGPTPRGLAVTPDGRVLVTRFLSPEDHAEVWEVSAGSMTRTRTIRLAEDLSPDDETGGAGILNFLQCVVVSPSGNEAILPAKKDNTRRGLFRKGLPLTFESTVRTVSARLDLAANSEDPSRRNDFDNASLATAAAFSPLGDLLFVALQGNNAVHVLDPYNNGAVLERIPKVGAAPRGLVVDGRTGRLYVHNFLDRAVSVYDIATVLANSKYESKFLKSVATVVREALPADVLKGKRIFYNAADSNMSKDNYISCAVCHLDGATDGRVWDFTDRGEGLRRTTSLLGRGGMAHGPVHWSANFDEIQDFEHDMRGPFGGRGFMPDADFLAGTRNTTLGDKKAGLSPELDALAAYVASLDRVNPSPFRNADGSLTDEGRAGEMIFHRAETGCANCHVPPRFTDSDLKPPDFTYGIKAMPGGFLLHDVGTLKPSSGRRLKDSLQGLDTPTLLGVWETGPYLHDGSAPTLMDVLTTANAGDKHGHTSQLNALEKDQLVAFLLQLDQGPAPVAVRPAGKVPMHAVNLRIVPGPAGGARIVLGGWTGREIPRLTLWDGRGRLVKSFADGELRRNPAGEWTAAWGGRDAEGRGVTRGVLLLRAGTGAFSMTATLPWVH